MAGLVQRIKNYFKSKPHTILRKPFEKVNEFYTIHEVLGKGAFGETYRCTEKYSTDNKSYACKKISKMISQADHKENIRREIEIMQLLSGRPNIVGFKSVHEDENFVHLVMDFCEGGELPVNRQYDQSDAARICKQILEAVRACHSINVMHRDIKPQNLLFSTKDVSNAPLKLSDFGVSVFIKEGRYEKDRVGAAPYTAPEIIDHRYGKEADMWSVGVILYSLLSGRLPFRGVRKEDVEKAICEDSIDLKAGPWGSISPDAKDLVRKMLTRNPRERITAAEALAHPWITHPWITASNDEGGRKKKSVMKKFLGFLICVKGSE